MTKEEKRKSVLKFLKAKGYMNQAQQEYMFNVVELILEYTKKSCQADSTQALPLRIINGRDLKPGDTFLWQSGMTGKKELHCFHSDVGYGVKTYTDYKKKDGSSLIVNWSGVVGKVVVGGNAG